MTAQIIAFPTSHSRIAAQRIGASAAELDQVAAEIEAIVAEIHRIIASDNAKRESILKEWDNG